MSKRNSNINCAVVGCNNTYMNTTNVQFYSFPGRNYEVERRSRWIQAVKRTESDGSPWQPTKNSKICSVHFFGNKKSEHPFSKSYLPTLFPPIYKRKNKGGGDNNRFKRMIDHEAKLVCRPTTQTIDLLSESMPSTHLTFEVSLQTDFNDSVTGIITDKTFICNRYVTDGLSEAECQVSITFQGRYNSVADKKCGPDPVYNINNSCLECEGFHGYPSIETEDELKDLTGINRETFDILLHMLPDRKGKGSSNENRLLICLMKIKTGLTYSALRVLFGVHHTTISRTFLDCLYNLVHATQQFIFWPSKDAILGTLPKSFKNHYPNCRVIIDCTEIKTEQPPTVEQRIYMYSHYKGTYTVKVLLGIAPNGMITFVSKSYGGRSSDTFITNDSGILNMLEPGDIVLADKGFPGITTDDKQAIVVTPPYLHNGRFSEQEVHETYNVASVRIHVERAIQRVKIYNIFQKINTEILPHIDAIICLCCVLTNLQPLIIKENVPIPDSSIDT